MRKQLYDIECIFYDFDGVMTDNRVLIDQNGLEYVCVNRSDGYAIARLKELGYLQVIVSTETNPVVEKRAEKLKIPVIHGVDDKSEIIINYCEENGIDLNHTVFMGNDLNDLSAFQVVGFKAAPRDAEQEILDKADWISKKNGGDGAIRDLYRMLASKFGTKFFDVD